jgi:hypothetical protein
LGVSNRKDIPGFAVYFADWQKKRHGQNMLGLLGERQRKRYSTVFAYLRGQRRYRASFIQRVVQNDSSEEAKKATYLLIAFVFGYPEPGRAGTQRYTREARERDMNVTICSLRPGSDMPSLSMHF